MMIAFAVYVIILCAALVAVALTVSIEKGVGENGNEEAQDQRKNQDRGSGH